jgi:preprotein translocase subunit SecB
MQLSGDRMPKSKKNVTAPSLRFLNVSLSKLFFELNDESILHNADKPIPFNVTIEGNEAFDKKNLILSSSLGVKILEKEEKPPFKIEAEVKARFKLDKEPEDMIRLARINCAAMIFPFLREAIADITRRAGMSPLLLPSINFLELFKNKPAAPARIARKKKAQGGASSTAERK